MGHVLTANCGQNPARQAMMTAKFPANIDCTNVNKVCASGMKAITFGAQSIALGIHNVVVAGGMESMSRAPRLLPRAAHQAKYGSIPLLDSIFSDGLQDVYSGRSMGELAEFTFRKLGISRLAQDEYALNSYRKASAAWKCGAMVNEVVPFKVDNSGTTVSQDEEFDKVLNVNKVAALKPVFNAGGTITSANASKISDGAAAIAIVSRDFVTYSSLTPLAKILAFADAGVRPDIYGNAAAEAAKKAVALAGLRLDQIDVFEINEAFSGLVISVIQQLGIHPSRVNMHGGAVSIGHPLAMSGCRVVLSLLSVMQRNRGKFGCATICNGGGGGTAVVLEFLAE
eukprot:Filipodium_phascolosomae@DN4555_c0_g1_i1.p1